MELARHRLMLVDPHASQDLNCFEFLQCGWRVGRVHRLEQDQTVRPDYFGVLLPILWFGRQPSVFDAPPIAIEPFGRRERA
jgi:hypothetical protein